MRHAWLVAALSTVACGTNPSQLDPSLQQAPLPAAGGKGRVTEAPADPWASPPKTTTTAKEDSGGSGLSGIMSSLEKVLEGLKRPGPYEAPKSSPGFQADEPHWGILELGGGIVEKRGFSLTGGAGGTELRVLTQRLHELARDNRITGLLLRIDKLGASLPDIAELRTAMHDVRAAKKKLVCHVEGAANATYLILSACDRIGLAPLGDIAITGPAAMPVHIKPLLDKLGVTADFLHVGDYKGAAEPLTRNAPSKEMEETLGAILDRRYATLVDTIAKERKIDVAAVKDLVDTALFPADAAKKANLVDEVASFEEFRTANVTGPWTRLRLDDDNDGGMLKQALRLGRFVGAMPPETPLGPHVAVVYALGNIVDGDGRGVLGARDEIAGQTTVAALRALTADDEVKAVVLRIDSGGGSAQASELIWRAVADLKAKKPVIVSMSDVAASGGYYIACGATKIFAQPDTLTGSIGVVGGKIALADALARLGVNTFPMGRGKRSTMMGSFAAWNPEEKAIIQASMENVYEVFVSRVAAGRGKTVEQVKAIAQGRVWTGEKAKELGLVDELGGLDAAIAEAAKLAKVDATDIAVFPPTPTLRDFLKGFAGVSIGNGVLATQLDLVAAGALDVLDPKIAKTARSLLGLVESFHTTQIQTVAILPEIR